MEDTGKAVLGAAAVLVVIAIVVGLIMLFGAVAVGAANSWIMQGNFSDGWSAAWDRKLPLLGWSILFLGSTSGANVKR